MALKKRELKGLGPERFHLVDLKDDGDLKTFREMDGPNIILGAGYVGGRALDACVRARVPVTAFCDNDPEKKEFRSLRVLSPQALASEYPNAKIILAAGYMTNLSAQLANLGFSNCYTVRFLDGLETDSVMDDVVLRTCLSPQKDFFDYPEILGSGFGFEVFITEKCSLRCRECSALVPYRTNPVHMPTGKLKKDLDLLCASLDRISELRIVGGEPMLHPDFHEVVAHCASKENVERVTIITNGTVVPGERQWRDLTNDKVLFRISDYGDLSAKRDRLVSEAAARGVQCVVITQKFWLPWRLLAGTGSDPGKAKELFWACGASTCVSLWDGRVYRCVMTATGTNLGAIPEDPGSFVDLYAAGEDARARRETGKALWRLVYETESLSACAYCLGCLPWSDAPKVQPARQVKAGECLPLPRT